MNRTRVGGCALAALLALQCVAFAGSDPADDRTRTFPELKFRFTLPDAEWEWGKEDAGLVFIAKNPDGVVAYMTAVNLPAAEIEQYFVQGFEQKLFSSGDFQKRDGKYLSFAGVPCYEVRCRLRDASTAIRVFCAHGNVYTLSVLGGSEPIEEQPIYQELLRGFEFTTPPEVKRARYAPGSDEERAYRLGRAMGAVIGMCLLGLMGAGFVWLVSRIGRNDKRRARKAPRKQPQSESIFLEDDE